MEFDNAKFERNVETSLGSLRHLDRTLNEIDGTSFNKLSGSVDYIADKFTFFGTLTRNVFERISNGIIDVSERMIRGFTIDQMASGWDKYAEKTTSVQTIMSATGDSIEYVTEQLDKLNWFTDETSYNFTDMTSNIAKFTSQGINLKDAVNEMQGIALWAASAGQNAQAASRAMYNISQAMGSGAMKLIDWKSIQNANMATKEFKEEAIKAAVAVGTLAEEGDHWVTTAGKTEVTLKNFDQTLAKGWLNSEAMELVFNKYGMFADVLHQLSDASGLTATELLEMYDCFKAGGDIQEEFANEVALSNVSAEELLKTFAELNTEGYALGEKAFRLGQEAKTFGDAMDATADAVSTAWMNLFETIFGNYEQQKKIWTDLSVSMYDWFAEPINNITTILREAMGFGKYVGQDVADLERYKDAVILTGESLAGFGSNAELALKRAGLLTDEMIRNAGSFENALKTIHLSHYDLTTVLNDLFYNGTAYRNEMKAIYDHEVEILRQYQSLEEAIMAHPELNESSLRMTYEWLQQGLDPYEEYCKRLGQYTYDISEADNGLIDELLRVNRDLVSGYKDVELTLTDFAKLGDIGKNIILGWGFAADSDFITRENYNDWFDENNKFYGDAEKLMELFSHLDASIGDYGKALEEAGKHTDEMTEQQLRDYQEMCDAFDDTVWHYKKVFAQIQGEELPFNDTFKTAVDDLTVFGDTAENILRKHGYLTDDLIKQYGSVDEAIRHLKIPANEYREVLNEIQQNTSEFTDEEIQSIIEYQKNLSDVIEAYNTLDDKIEGISGQELLWNPDFGAFYNLMDIISEIGALVSKAWNNVFDGNKVELVYNFIASLQQGTAKILSFLTDSEEETHRLERILTGLFSLLDIGQHAISAIFDGAKKILQMLGFVGEGALDGAASLADWIVALDKAIKDNQIFEIGVGFLVNVIGSFIDIVRVAVDKLKDLYNSFKNLEKVKAATAWIKETFNIALAELPNLITNARETLLTGFGVIINFFTTTIPNAIGKVISYIRGIKFDKLFSFITKIKNGIVDLFKMIKQLIITKDWQQFIETFAQRFPKISEVIGNVKDSLSKFFSFMKEQGAPFVKRALAALMSIIAVLLTIKTILSFNKVLDSTSGFLDTLSDMFSGIKKTPKILAIVGIVAGLVILVGELRKLADIPADDLKRAGWAIGQIAIIIGALIGIGILAAKFEWSAGIGAVGGGVLKFAAALGILALSLYGISKIPSENFGRSIATLIGMMLALAVVARMMSKKSIQLVTGGSGLIMYAIAIGVLAKALKTIQDNAENLSVKAFLTLIGIMGALAVLSTLIRGVRFGGAVGILLLALSLVKIEEALMNAIDHAIPFETFKQYWKELTSIVVMLAGFALITRLTGKGSVKGVLSLLALIGLLYLLPGVIAKLGSIPSDQLWKGVETIAIIGLVLAGVLAATSLVAKMTKEGLKTVKWILIGIAGLVLAVYLMRDMTMEQLLPAVISIGTVMVALGAAILLATIPLSRAKKVDVTAVIGLVVILAAIGGVIAALWWFASQDLPNLTQVALALGTVMVALGATLFIIGNIKNPPGFLDSIKIMWQAILILVPVITALWAIQKFDIQASIKTVTALSVLLLALSGCLFILSHTKGDWKQALANGGSLLIASGSLIAIAFALSLLKDINLEGVTTKLLIFGGVLIELSVCLAILSLIPNPAAVGTALLGLLAVTAVLGALMIAMANLGPDNDQMVKVAPKLTNGFTLMGEAIGAFIGGFIGGIGVGLTATMIQMADNLTMFANRLQPFLESIGQITDSQVKGMDSLTALMLKLAAAELLNSISNVVNFFTAFQPSLATKLVQFGNGMAAYLESIKDVTQAEVDRGTQLTDSFAKLLTALPKNGGLFQMFTGGQDFKKFSKQLVNYGEALKSFCESVGQIGEGAYGQMTMASFITDVVVEIANKIPNMTSALVAAFTGDNNASKFGQRMSYFMFSLVEVCTAAAKFKEEDLTALALAKSVSEATIEVSSILPQVAGWFQEVFAIHDDPSKYGIKMAAFMNSLVAMTQAVAPLTPDDLTQMNLAKSVTIIVVSMAELIPQVMSLLGEVFYTHDNPALFGNRMASFIGSLAQAAQAAATIPEDAVMRLEHAKQTTIKVLEAMAVIPSSNIFTKKSFATSGDIIAFGNSIVQFGQVMSKYVQSISAIDAEKALQTTQYLTQIAIQLNGLSGKFSVIAVSSQNVVTSFSNAVRAIEQCCHNMLTVIMNFSNNFERAGNYFGYGFATGIMAQIPNVERAASNLGVAAANALARAARIHSPSRVTQEMGGYFGEGWIDGIEGMYHAAAVTAEGLAETTIDAVAYAREAAANLLSSDYDPVIRPVVDLSEVKRAADNLKPFENVYSVSGPRKVAEVSTVVETARQQKTAAQLLSTNSSALQTGNFSSSQSNAILSELRRLGEDFGTLSENMSHLQMVLDSGVLVGELAPYMNTQLGALATRERRQ